MSVSVVALPRFEPIVPSSRFSPEIMLIAASLPSCMQAILARKLCSCTQAGALVMISAGGEPSWCQSAATGGTKKMGPPASDFIAREARFGAQNYEPLGVVLSRGEGVFVWDTQGNH